MPRILAIADDLTGAAEVAGVAARFGLDTQLMREPVPPPVTCDCVVYDTDSRLLSVQEAIVRTRRFAEAARAGVFDVVYKKTDSVLRGEPLAEITAVAEVFRRKQTLFLPHNPSRERCVVNGVYRVRGLPLHETEFAFDPLHPATTSDVIRLLRPAAGGSVASVPAGGPVNVDVTVGEAATIEDVADWAGRFDPDRHLAAGGADFFEAVCRRLMRGPVPEAISSTLPRPLLFVSGTASPATQDVRRSLDERGQLFRMPDDLFEHGINRKNALFHWAGEVLSPLKSTGMAMMTIGRPADATPGKAELLGRALVESAARVIQLGQVRAVACEGGATAALLCDTLRWHRFKVDAELIPGVVSLRVYPGASGMRLVVKPGSYAWPEV